VDNCGSAHYGLPFLSPLSGPDSSFAEPTHGLRHGLHSFAPLRGCGVGHSSHTTYARFARGAEQWLRPYTSRCQASLYFSYLERGLFGVRRMSGWWFVASMGRMYHVSVGIT